MFFPGGKVLKECLELYLYFSYMPGQGQLVLFLLLFLGIKKCVYWYRIC